MSNLRAIFRQFLIRAAAGAARFDADDEWVRFYSELLYIYHFGLPEVRARVELRQPVLSHRADGDRGLEGRLEAQEVLMFSLLGAISHDPSPQPTLRARLDRPDIRLEAARGLAEQMESGLKRLHAEIERLEKLARQPA